MSVFEFVLRLIGILIPAARKQREEDAAERERPLLDEEEELRKAREEAERRFKDLN